MKKTQLLTPETFAKYKKHIEYESLLNRPCFFCFSKSIRKFKYWALKENDFPYDIIAEEHVMLSPHEHVKDREHLSFEAEEELLQIIKEYNKLSYYDTMLENFKTNRTIRDHYHIHLLKYITNINT